MSRQVKDEGAVPAERWHFPVAATNTPIYAPNYVALYPKILEHCKTNNVQPPSQQEVVDWVCEHLSIDCYDSHTHEPLINRWSQGIPPKLQTGCCGK